MSNPSPPKPWERAGAGTVSGAPLTSSTTSQPTSTMDGSSTAPPALPSRPATLSSVVNQTASNYSTMNGAGAYGASPYGMSGMNSTYGTGYNSYSSPYNRFGGMGGSMYGGGMGGMGGGMYGGMGGGMYGGGMGGMYGNQMGMDPNNPSLTQSFSNSTQATFQLIQSIVGAFGGFAQMLESTFMATHSSFFAMVSVAEQFGNLRQTLGSVLGIYTVMGWLRSLLAKVTGRPPPARSTDLTPAKFAKFNGRLPDGSPAPPAPSRKPLLVFALAVFGLPYLMGKLIKALARSQEESERRRLEALPAETPLDPSQLLFCKVLYDFNPENGAAVPGVDLAVIKGDLVAVLSKADPLGNPSDWWRCRARDGRMGYLPAPYLEPIQRRVQNAIAAATATTPAGSRAHTMTTTVAGSGSTPNSRASTLTGMKVEDLVKGQDGVTELKPEVVGKPNQISVESFQKSMFNNS
ncbi:hypothetical protein BT63DRAFT_33133 [Microthyrium microscopicum]|uniref:Peroxisomal membrane protein PEX13 n=1 Tax=Microthyrium microscopicum TaxID=703497 RepID=A0A6A6UV13_9PEZI|nr:hypothetical protein BT63DRAFT_33133 [Microthyrium microscopicum]